jgi:tRNA modification GTPase
VVLLTPEGRGAVATIAVIGSHAAQLVAELFVSARGRSLETASIDVILFGRWQRTDGEEVVVCRTAPDTVEIHCHGGRIAAQAILESLVARGVFMIEREAWLASRVPGELESAALLLLPQARTFRTAAILHDQTSGAMRRAIEQMLATLDSDPSSVAAQLDTLLSHARLGQHLIEPWRVVFSGPPNVGKSSLINALVGYERAIVYDEPGTTRDAVTVATALDGWPVELCDTAGLRYEASGIERLGIERAVERLATADCRVLVFEAASPWTADLDALLAAWPGAIVVHNKADLAPADTSNRPAGLATSARTRQGIDLLAATIARSLVPAPPASGDALPITPTQVAVLKSARESLSKNDFTSVRTKLNSLFSRDA